jgi:mycothiol synthase
VTDHLVSRQFRWDDVPGLHLLMRLSPSQGKRSTHPHIGDFYWGLRSTPDDDPLNGMRVWFADTSLAAVAWLDQPNSGDAIVAADAGESALKEALDWLEREHRARGTPSFSIVVQDGDTFRMAALRRRGYRPSAGGNVRFRRALDSAPAPAPLAAGFSLRHVATDDDIDRRVFVETSSFGATVTPKSWRLLARNLPDYRPSLDLLAVAADGTGASACTCWYDGATRVGEFEAVGTAQPFRRLGLGKAVITEGLRRLRELGAVEAVLYTNIGNVASAALYRSCGFELVGEDHAWTKQL